MASPAHRRERSAAGNANDAANAAANDGEHVTALGALRAIVVVACSLTGAGAHARDSILESPEQHLTFQAHLDELLIDATSIALWPGRVAPVACKETTYRRRKGAARAPEAGDATA